VPSAEERRALEQQPTQLTPKDKARPHERGEKGSLYEERAASGGDADITR
jgi:hypothetical protein